jgi:D-arabinose 1-dehydrogenase-like Zn-dependent alcohol dehydrogenase
MKALRLIAYHSVPQIVDVPDPEIESPSDVIVKISGAGVCNTDVHIVEGKFRSIFPSTVLPFTLGHENVGRVEKCGSGVSGFQKGDPVIVYSHMTCGLCENCRLGRDMHCSHLLESGIDGTDGGFAEYVRANDRSIILVKERENLYELAPVADAGISSYHAIKRISHLISPGSIVVVFGIGGLGHFAIQLLKIMTPATVVAISESKERLALAKKLGADHCVVSDPETVEKEVLDLSEGRGADVVLDLVGNRSTPDQALRMIKKGGTYSIVGYGGTLSAPTQYLVAKEINIMGNLVGTFNELTELMKLCDEGRLVLQTNSFPLEKGPEIFESLMHGRRYAGRPVLLP